MTVTNTVIGNGEGGSVGRVLGPRLFKCRVAGVDANASSCNQSDEEDHEDSGISAPFIASPSQPAGYPSHRAYPTPLLVKSMNELGNNPVLSPL